MKVTIIGGGSYTWAFGFCRQFVLSEQLQDVHVTLMDTNPAALALVHAAATRFNLAHGSPITLESSSNLEAALDGADYVVVSISTGGLEAMQHDIAIPERYGILHTVGDTVGPGGLLRAVRNIPVFHDFGEKMKRLCPNAWFINVSNPLTPLTRVPQRNFGIRSIGMCPGVESCVRSLAEIAGAPSGSQADYTVTGIDHGSWFTRIAAGNLDVMQRLKEMGYYRSDDRLPDQALTEDPHIGLVSGMRAGFAIWRELGYLPSIWDRHTVENWPWFLAGDNAGLPFGIQRTSTETRRRSQESAAQPLHTYLDSGDESSLGWHGPGDDPIVTLIEALSGYRTFVWGANYTNIGQIPELPANAVIELAACLVVLGFIPITPLCLLCWWHLWLRRSSDRRRS